MKIAVEGCAHGELDNIYESVRLLEECENIQIDLLICCGDFQASRNEEDLLCMAIPEKYNDLCSFYKYYNGEKVAPVLTIFIGGNHEASNYLQELPYGGWVAPNIYYLGYAGVINIAGIRIAGVSGIYKGHDYRRGHFEIAPYSDSSKRSVYHTRNLEVFRLKQLKQPVDIFLSHDWPVDITNYGNCAQLVKFKPFFKEDIQSGKLGSPPYEELLHHIRPLYWFAAHLHCKFAALVPHSDGKRTKFLSLDKCLPKRKFLQVVDLSHDQNKKIKITYDLEWLSILHATNHLLSVKNTLHYMPGPNGTERWSFTPTKEEEEFVLERFEHNLVVPENFVTTVAGQNSLTPKRNKQRQPSAILNPQTKEFCQKLSVDDPVELILKSSGAININQCDSVTEHSMTKSFIEDSQIFEQDIEDDTQPLDNSSSVKLEKLLLPLPKNDDNESIEEELAKTELTSERINEFSDEKVEVEELSSKLPENSQESIDTIKNPETPVNKKFKRRNADIYSTPE